MNRRLPNHASRTNRSACPEIDALLQVEGLCGGYGQSQVLVDVSFEVPTHGAVSIVGLNGAGKTTLLRHLIGELPRTAGRVVLDGNDIPASMLPSVLSPTRCRLCPPGESCVQWADRARQPRRWFAGHAETSTAAHRSGARCVPRSSPNDSTRWLAR